MTESNQTPQVKPAPLRIDFVSDVSCPWCAVGLLSLEHALKRLEGEVSADIHFQPFELNPQMAEEGEDIAEHIRAKYGATQEQLAESQDHLRERGAALGFDFRMDRRRRIYNTFDAHRLLHWAGFEQRQQALKHILLRAYFTDGENVGDHDTLVRLAVEAGLSAERARGILGSDEYKAEVCAQEAFFIDKGINAVPAVIINERHLISGGQPVEVFERALRDLAARARSPSGAGCRSARHRGVESAQPTTPRADRGEAVRVPRPTRLPATSRPVKPSDTQSHLV
ncbi:MAG: DsbA family oxidoreductase [Rudaea sp.]